jgi:hypothetical protein
MTGTAVVSAAEIEAFQRDGAVCLRQVLSVAQIELLKAGIDWNLSHPSPRAKVASQPRATRAGFIEDFCNWQENAACTASSSSASALDGSHRGAADDRAALSVRLYHDHMLTKEARAPAAAHALAPGPALLQHRGDSRTVSFWIPVDPVSRECDARVRRLISHAGPWLMPQFLHGRAGEAGSRKARWRTCPTSTPTATRTASSAGRSSPAMRCVSTCSPCTPRVAQTRDGAAGSIQCDCSAMISGMHLVPGSPHRIFQA